MPDDLATELMDSLTDTGSTSATDDQANDQQLNDDQGLDDQQQQDDQQQDQQQQAEGSDQAAGKEVTPAEVKSAIDSLRQTNPRVAKELNGAFYAQRQFKQEFPGGINEARELKAFVDEIGGKDGFAGVQSKLNEYTELDKLVESGDPKAIEQWAEAFPESIAQLAPHFIGKWQQMDPEGYTHQMVGIVAGTLQNAGLDNTLVLLSRQLEMKDEAGAKETLKNLIEWSSQLKASAGKPAPVKQPKAQDDKLAQREAAIKQQETQMFTKAVTDDVLSWRGGKINELLKGEKLNQDRMEALQYRVASQIKALVYGNKQFADKLNAYANAGDRAGLTKHIKTAEEKVIADIVTKSYRALFGTQPKGGKPNEQKPGDNGKAQVPSGWIQVAKAPDNDAIDRTKTDRGMILVGKAILRDGRKVTWQ